MKKFLAISHNFPVYAMFASGIIARNAYHWQIWVGDCGGTEQAVTAYAVLYAVVQSNSCPEGQPLYFGGIFFSLLSMQRQPNDVFVLP